MKKLLLLALVCGIYVGSFAQPEPFKAKGKISANSENESNEADPVFSKLNIDPATIKKTGQGGNAQQVSQLENGMKIVTDVVDRMINSEYSFSLLSSHKYMVNDCLGMKVSSGQFKLKFSSPSIEVTNSGHLKIRLEVNKINFSALKVRIKPRAPDLSDPNPCHFSGKFEIGGEATDLSVTLTLNLVVSSLEGSSGLCFFAFGAPVSIKWNIGGLNLKPHPNALDNVAKEMVEDALNTGLDGLLYTKFIQLSREVIPKYYEACEQAYNAETIKKIANPAISGSDSSGKWDMKPNKLKTSTGRLLLNNPAGSIWTVYIYRMADNKYVTSANNTNNKGLFVLAPGEYKVTINDAPVKNVQIKAGNDTKLRTGVLNVPAQGVWNLYDVSGKDFHTSGNKSTRLALPIGQYKVTLNNAPIENVSIEDSLDTKIKTGILDITENDVWYLYDEAGKESYTSGNKPEKLILPEGKYTLKVGGNEQRVVVKEEGTDGGNPEIEDLKAAVSNKWEITPLPASKGLPDKKSMGTLDMNFLKDSYYNVVTHQQESWKMKISRSGHPDILIGPDDFKGNPELAIPSEQKGAFYPLEPGEYQVEFNKVPIANVPVQPDKETRLRAGLLQIDYDGSTYTSVDVVVYIHDKLNPYNNYYIMCKIPGKISLPAGTYGLKVRGTYPINEVVIMDRETKKLAVPVGSLTIHSYDCSWSLYDYDVSVTNPYSMGGNGPTFLNLPAGSYRLVYQKYPSGTNQTMVVTIVRSQLNTVTLH